MHIIRLAMAAPEEAQKPDAQTAVSQTEGIIFSGPLPPPEEDPEPVLIKYRAGVDLLRKTSYPPARQQAYDYEDRCFAYDVGGLSGIQYGFGPGIVDEIFGNGFPSGIIRPDAIIVDIGSGEITLKKLNEYKSSGRRHIEQKLAGFEKLTGILRNSPGKFSSEFMRATGGTHMLYPLVVPPDDEIIVEIMSPMGLATPEGQFVKFGNSSFRLRLVTVPLPSKTEAQPLPVT